MMIAIYSFLEVRVAILLLHFYLGPAVKKHMHISLLI